MEISLAGNQPQCKY